MIEDIKKTLWATADKLRANMDAAEYILGSVPVVMPSATLLCAFENVVSAIEAGRAENSERVRTLALIRDTLLPRLTSGQLRLPDVAEQIEEALFEKKTDGRTMKAGLMATCAQENQR